LQEGVFGPYLPAFAVSLQQEGLHPLKSNA
jgi:hypothetical protein